VRLYETTFIVNPQADDAAIDRQVSAVTELIKNNEGEIIREDRLGTRRLAYSIAGLTQGFFASIIFKAPVSVLPVLERHYKLEEPYVRYLTIKYERDIKDFMEEKEPRPAVEVKKETDKPADKPAAPETPKAEAKEEPKAEVKEEPKAEAKEEPKAEAKEEPKVAAEETATKTVETPVEEPAPKEPETPASDEEL
jgi:small subunit ribosomal protein S6